MFRQWWHGWRRPHRDRWRLELKNFDPGVPSPPRFSRWWDLFGRLLPAGIRSIVVALTILGEVGALTLRTSGQGISGQGRPLFTNTVDASQFTGTKEQKIQQAINLAGAIGGQQFVWIPLSMIPYNSSLVTFNLTGAKMIREGGINDFFDVVAYGAAADGVTDDSNAILQASAAANARAGGGTVFFSDFQANAFLVNSPLTFNAYTDVTFLGQGGPNQTRIQMGAAGAHCMNFTGVCSRITIRDLWLGSTAARASGFGLSVVGTVGTFSDSFTVERVTIQNVPTPFFLQYLGNSRFSFVRHYQSIAGATISPVFAMNSTVSVTFYDFLNQVTAGTLPSDVYQIDYDCDTCVFVVCQALNSGNYGYRLLKSAGSTGPRLVKFLGCYAESNTLDGWSIEAGRDVRLDNCHVAVNSRNGIQITGGDSIIVSNTLALSNNQHGIVVLGGTGVLLEGNTCSNNSQQTNVTYDGIRITTGASGVRVLGNRSGDFIFTLTNKQAYGININGTADLAIIMGNDLRGNTTGALAIFTSATNCIVTRNLGVTPAGVAAITVTASPFTYTNNDNVPEAVYISAGTITNITKNGIQIFGATTGETVYLEPGEAIIVTYTVAPTMNKDRK